MAKSKSARSELETKCALCGNLIPAGKTYRMVFDDTGMHVGDRCYQSCKGIFSPKDLIEQKLTQLEADERLHYPTANVFINAPLALEQINLEAQVKTLKWVLKILEGAA